MDRPMIVIGGGVGPMAGVELHRRIIENTATDGTDQDHLEVLHLSRSYLVGDRTDWLQGESVPDPSAGMVQVFRMAAAALALEGRRAVAGVPCNTFHAPRIFDAFMRGLEECGVGMGEDPLFRVFHMLRETADAIEELHQGARRIGLLSTTGTRVSGVYHGILAGRGMTVVEIPQEEQPGLHEAIYHLTWGLKAVSPPDRRAVERVERYAGMLVEARAEVIVLGCTELPMAIREREFAGVPCLDPMTALARSLVRATAPEKLLPLGDAPPLQ